jgi:hypothetical protein
MTRNADHRATAEGLSVGIEAQCVLPDDGPRRPIGDYIRRLTDAGFPCHEESDEGGHWIVFDGLQSSLVVSIEDGAVVFVTFEMSLSDPDEAIEGIGPVFAEAGWDTEPGDYE